MLISTHTRRLASALALAAAFAAAHATLARADEIIRVRGTIASFDGTAALVVKTREGPEATIALRPGFGVSGMARVSLSDIKPGDYVGIASVPGRRGGDDALEVLVFPAAMKGAGEGNYPWDLKPNSSMTNGSVAEAVKSVNGHALTLSYHGQSKTITVPNGVPVVTFAAADKGDLKPGAAMFAIAQKDTQGGLSAGRVTVGTNGVVPPM
ncbi:hypothetical protein [Chelatococcus reniformis]|uniref:DUF5666 domain-containing protein n=1 Tax=Chelatococcus reniformis TaxID=1494448 RepID=A0A916XNE2_9HYPH|nr:hypothetical protein [Chelatococcus reniformis]GGC89069.1 hypothetical protein GCM10010994_53660 [Chelatococcus reniformis]